MTPLASLMLEGSQRFNGKNYNTWKQRMMTIFEYRHLEALVLGTETHPTTVNATQEKFDERNREAVMLINSSVTDDQLLQVSSGKTTAEIWKTLKDLQETLDKSRAFFMKNQLFSIIIMDEHISLQEHHLKIKDIRDQLEASGHTMEEEDMVVITLKSLPPSYEHFIETLNIIATNVDLKFSDLCTKFGNNSLVALLLRPPLNKRFQLNPFTRIKAHLLHQLRLRIAPRRRTFGATAATNLVMCFEIVGLALLLISGSRVDPSHKPTCRTCKPL